MHKLRLWFATQVLAIVGMAYSGAFGQVYVSEYGSISIGSDGTVYATGITSAGGMQEHSADVSVFLYSPNGRSAVASDSEYSGGYARADTFLAFDENDVGDGSLTVSGSGTCPVVNDTQYGYYDSPVKFNAGEENIWYSNTGVVDPLRGICGYERVANCDRTAGFYCGSATTTGDCSAGPGGPAFNSRLEIYGYGETQVGATVYGACIRAKSFSGSASLAGVCSAVPKHLSDQ